MRADKKGSGTKFFMFESDVELMARELLVHPHRASVMDVLMVADPSQRSEVALAPVHAVEAAAHVSAPPCVRVVWCGLTL